MDGLALEDYIKNERRKLKGGRKGGDKGSGQRKTGSGRPSRPHKEAGATEGPKVWKKQLISVDNLPAKFNNENLRDLVGKFGTLTRCNILFDKTGESRVT